MSPRFRIGRHLLLVLSLGVIAFNQSAIRFWGYPEITGTHVLLSGVALWAAYTMTAYLNIYGLITRYLAQKKYGQYLMGLSVLIVFFLGVKYGLESCVFWYFGVTVSFNFVTILDLFSYFVLDLICIVGTSVPVLVRRWIEDRELIQKMEKDRLQSQIEHMKDQIHPQFLFNVLAYTSETVSVDPDKSSEMLFALSRLLKYELYDSNREMVLLHADLQFISDYLKLEQMIDGNFSFTIQKQGNLDGLFIPSFLLISLIQNLTAHLRYNGRKRMDILVRVQGEGLVFYCETDGFSPDKNAFTDFNKRLELLYGIDFSFVVTENNLNLQINTSNYVGSA